MLNSFSAYAITKITMQFICKEGIIPFQSESQRKYLFSQKPEVAREFAEHTPKSAYKKLPEHVSKDKDRFRELSKKYRRNRDG